MSCCQLGAGPSAPGLNVGGMVFAYGGLEVDMRKMLKTLASATALVMVAALPATAAGPKNSTGPKAKAPKTTVSAPKSKAPSTKAPKTVSAKPVKSTAAAGAKKAPGGSKKSPSTTTATTTTPTTTTPTTPTTTTPTTAGTWTPTNAVSQKLSTKPNLLAKVKGALPVGTDLNAATAGFKNFGQFIAATNVSTNLGIDFGKLKAAMTGTDLAGLPTGLPTSSLGQAIQQLKPGVDATTEATRAETLANQQIAGN